MRKLLSANFARLFKSNVFWTLEGGSFLLGVVFYVWAINNTKNIGINWLLCNANAYFYSNMVCIGSVLAIFASLFIGTEYADGTIRNKLCVGHSRRNIYLANVILTVAVGMMCWLAHIVAAIVIGLPFAGREVITGVSLSMWRVICCVLIIVADSALFTLFAMLDNNKAHTSIITLLLSLCLVVGGMYVYSTLQQPELTSRMVMQADGSYQRQDNIPNKRYVSGTTRVVYEWIDATIPSAQAFRIVNRDGVFDGRIPFCLAGLTVLLTGSGVVLFQKKDIR